MTKFDPTTLTPQETEKLMNKFFQTVADLKNLDETKRFFKDLLSKKETAMLARRLEVAKLLELGFTFEEIQKKLRVGVATVTSVNRWLNYGRNGYKIVVGRLIDRENEKREKESLKIKKMTNPFDYKYKYPHVQITNITKGVTRAIKRKIKEHKLKKRKY